jgi:preprotein translocase subunit Sss1
MNKEIEGAVDGLKSFYGESRRFLEVCDKPDMTGNSPLMQNSKK